MPTFTVPVRNYAVGTHSFGPVNVPDGLTTAVISVTRAEWTSPAVTLSMRIELSLDDGATWSPEPEGQEVFPWTPFPATFTARGGVLQDLDGSPLPTSSITLQLPEPSNQDRRVRAVATVAGGTLRTSMSVVTS
jgi:hypothetical protein